MKAPKSVTLLTVPATPRTGHALARAGSELAREESKRFEAAEEDELKEEDEEDDEDVEGAS
jgi:ribosomal protein L12E/L44/L45/RPP1/RPP2